MSHTGTLNASHSIATRPIRPIAPSRQPIFSLSDLLPLHDFIGVLVAACCALSVHFGFLSALSVDAWLNLGNLSFMGALLATCILYDQQFGARVDRPWLIAASFAVRALLVIATVYTAGSAFELTAHAPRGWLELWFSCALTFTVSGRWYVAKKLRSHLHQEREGNYEHR
jgi:hypothetical protein